MTFKNKRVVRTVQIIFGLILVIFGLNGFLQFMPAPVFNQAGTDFIGALFASGFIFPLISLFWISTGIKYLFNKYSAVGTIEIVPISVIILLFHLFLDTSGIGFAMVIILPNLYMFLVHWDKYKLLFR